MSLPHIVRAAGPSEAASHNEAALRNENASADLPRVDTPAPSDM